MQFMSFELGSKLKRLVEQIQLSMQTDTAMGSDVACLEQLDYLKDVASEASDEFSQIQTTLRGVFDRMQEEVQKWK